jgi:hypothetical protein
VRESGISEPTNFQKHEVIGGNIVREVSTFHIEKNPSCSYVDLTGLLQWPKILAAVMQKTEVDLSYLPDLYQKSDASLLVTR